MGGSILIIDDENVFREDLAALLTARGLTCVTAAKAQDGIEAAEQYSPDVILCDIVLPDRKGSEIVEELIRRSGEGAVIMMTAYGSVETAIEAFRLGALDYVLKPVVVDDIVQRIDRILRTRAQGRELQLLRSKLACTARDLAMVVRSPAMRQVLELIEKVAGTGSTVLITGETGSGKEVVARAIHERSTDGQGPFVPVNCAAIPEHLIESELFGHVRGAFTGADRVRVGFFELADHGTLFLDEIVELRPELQTKLLRAIEEKSVRRIGSTVATAVNVQIMAATNRDVQAEVLQGTLRQDLYYRLAVVDIALPPLRERREDIQPLTEQFIDRFSMELKRRRPRLRPETLQAFMLYRWPGNVRELENAIERAIILGRGDWLELDDLPPTIVASLDATSDKEGARVEADGRDAATDDDLRKVLRSFERAHIDRVLAGASGNREETARRLGIGPSTLYRKMADLGLGDS